MDTWMIFVAGLIIGIIIMSIIVVACKADDIERDEHCELCVYNKSADEIKQIKRDRALDGVIIVDPWEEIVQVGENKYMIKTKSRR